MIKHVGIAENDTQLEELKKLAEALKFKLKEEKEGPFLFDMRPEEPFVSESKKAEFPKKEEKQLVDVESLKEECRIVEGFHDIFGTLYNQLGFHCILKGPQKDVLRDVVLARIACPVSKAATQQILAADFGREIDLDRIYRMMDALVE